MNGLELLVEQSKKGLTAGFELCNSEIERKHTLMSRIAKELTKQGRTSSIGLFPNHCSIYNHGDTTSELTMSDDVTEKGLIEWLEKLQDENNAKTTA